MAPVLQNAPLAPSGNFRKISLLCLTIAALALSGCSSIVGGDVKSASITTETSHAFPAKTIKPKSKIAAVNRRATAGRTAVKASANVPFYGRAPYICTPSGFGQTTRCFRRA